ncbi:MAG: DUF72 domain-containing protein [Deltaproteobacteria bacterium]|nr:DUF72 domain-containing protein [Deltaproteobacteria bacterium]
MATPPHAGQLPLFGGSAPKSCISSAPVSERVQSLARRLPPRVYLGTSSWSFPGWDGLVYGHAYPKAALAREGLTAYARHPLLGSVGLDRTFYGPIEAERFAQYAAEVPDDFRFLAKAHAACTLARFPDHPRYADRRGQHNPQWLDPHYAIDAVVGPFIEGLGAKAGVLLFQFSPQDEQALGGRHGFPEKLHAFLSRLPRGPAYAVELRNHKLATPAYRAALADSRTLHCVSVHPTMPDVRTQAQQLQVLDAPGLVVRWMLNPRMRYEAARRYYHPFDTLVDPDLIARHAIAELVRTMSERGRPSLVIVNNKAEGCAPLSIEALAEVVVGDSHQETP